MAVHGTDGPVGSELLEHGASDEPPPPPIRSSRSRPEGAVMPW